MLSSLLSTERFAGADPRDKSQPGRGSRCCDLGPWGAAAQRPLVPTGHPQPKATISHQVLLSSLFDFPAKPAGYRLIAAQASALKVTICFEKLKQQQLSFSRDRETGLQADGLLSRSHEALTQELKTGWLELPGRVDCAFTACLALGRTPADVPHPVHQTVLRGTC